MILDKALELASRQAVTATAVSTNTIDAGSTRDGIIGRDIGAGTAMFATVTVNQTATAAGAATVRVTIQDSADNATFIDRVQSADVPVASLTAGYVLNLPLPPGLRRYIRANFTVGTGPLTAGQFSVHVTDGINFPRQYPAQQ
jgi:hypothetical protein